MKNHVKKLCSWGATLPIMLSILMMSSMLSIPVFADSSAGFPLGTVEVAPYDVGIFPYECSLVNIDSGTFSVVAFDNSTIFNLAAVTCDSKDSIISPRFTGKGELNFTADNLNPCYFTVTNDVGESENFTGNLLVKGEPPISADCNRISGASSFEALISGFALLIPGFVAILS
ncbi:MAG: hypothetical protein RUMPE_00630 [Eubacteriales bacterium SKADARSKE-1]|nr:hypothetical protein [Eubacteriales bacterium SKADARSKE-1]